MAVFVALVFVVILMSVSQKLWDNPLAFISVGFLGFCVYLLSGVALTAVSLPF